MVPPYSLSSLCTASLAPGLLIAPSCWSNHKHERWTYTPGYHLIKFLKYKKNTC